MNAFRSQVFVYWGLCFYAVASLGSMATMSIGVAVFLISLIIAPPGPKKFFQELNDLVTQGPTRSYFLASVFISFACLVSLLAAQISPLSYHQASVPVHLFKDLGKVWYFFLPLFLVMGWKRLTSTQQNQVIRTWVIAFGLISSVGVIQLFTGWPRASELPYISGYFLTVLFLGHHLSVASIWIFPFFACLDFLISPEAQKKLRLPRWSLILITLLGGFCLFFSWSRTLWVAMPFSLCLWAFLRLSRKGAIIGAITFALVGLSIYQVPFINQRLKSALGVHTRELLWEANIDFFKHRPWTGVGLGKNQALSFHYLEEKIPNQTSYFVGHAHNLYLEIIAGLGILGTLAWLVWLGVIFKNILSLYRLNQPTQFTAGLISAWLTFFINGLTQVNFWESKVLHQFMWTTGLVLLWASKKSYVSSSKN